MITSLVTWLTNIISILGYPGVALSMFMESFFAPIPSEIILPFSGFVASNGSMNIFVVILVAGFSAYLGSLPFYMIGRWGKGGVDYFLNKFGKYFFISAKDVQRGYNVFDRYGKGIVFFGRLVPIIRTIISFPAGVAKMNFFLFSLYTLLGSLIWSAILATAGYFLGSQWDVVKIYVSKYEKVVLVILVIVVIAFFARVIWKKSMNRSLKKSSN